MQSLPWKRVLSLSALMGIIAHAENSQRENSFRKYTYPQAWTTTRSQKQAAPLSDLTTVELELLNKISGKRTTFSVSIGNSLIVGDIRIVAQGCQKSQDSFQGEIFRVPVKIYLEQDKQDFQEGDMSSSEPVLLYQEELSTNPRQSPRPLEHPVYDVLVKRCD